MEFEEHLGVKVDVRIPDQDKRLWAYKNAMNNAKVAIETMESETRR